MKVKGELTVGAVALFLAVGLCAAPGLAQVKPAPRPSTIIEIRVEGNKYLSDAAVLANVTIRQGQRYDEELVRKDEQRLLKTRRYVRVQVIKTQTDKGVIVTFRVVERPVVVAVGFEGNKVFEDSELAGAISFSAGDPIDPYLIESARQAIESKYRSNGYYEAVVKYDKAVVRDKRRVVYTIREGHKAYIKSVRFKGNKGIRARRLKGAIKSRARLWPLITGVLDLELVERDVLDLRRFYRDAGYLGVQIDRDLAFSRDKNKVVLTFLIEEGQRYRIRKAIFKGTAVLAAHEVARHLRLTDGAVYNGLALRRDLERIRELYGEIGYIDAEVEVKTVYTDKPDLVDLVYTVREGEQFRIERVDIRGNAVTKMNVIRRQLQFRPGQVYNSVAVEDTRRRLMESELFDDVKITPVGEAPGRRDALVTVKEGRTGQFLIGAGVSTNAGLLGTISYTERNFDILAWPGSGEDVKSRRAFKGAGQILRIVAEPGTEFMRFRISWREPYLFDKPYSLGTNVFVFTSGRETYDETRYGGMVSLGRRFPNRWYGEVSGRIEGVRVDGLYTRKAPQDVRDVAGTSAVGGVKGTIVRDRTDSRWLPSAGDRIILTYEQVMLDHNFGKVTGDYRRYHTLYRDEMDRKHILALRAAGGAILGDAPVFERFYGGGLGSIRGFRFRGISPRQGQYRQVVGGDFTMFLGSEYTFPVIGEQLRGVVFLDTGTVERGVTTSDYRASVGVGLRWHVKRLGPVPIALDFGFPVSKTSDDGTQLISFSFGWAF